MIQTPSSSMLHIYIGVSVVVTQSGVVHNTTAYHSPSNTRTLRGGQWLL